MCRHFAWIGTGRTLHQLFFEPSYGLPHQARLPRWQQVGLVNKDGFGAGWYTPQGTPAVFRTTVPIWDEPSFPAMAKDISSTCVLGAARAASPGMPLEETANAPFTDGRCLLSLNGHLNADKAMALLEPGRVPESACDSALLAALLWQRLDQGAPLSSAVEGLVQDIVVLDPKCCLNLLATDGTQLVATTWEETLCYRTEPTGVLVASEPHDDTETWTTVPNHSLLVAHPSATRIRPLHTDSNYLLPNSPRTPSEIT